MHVPFNRPFIVGKELYYIAQAVMNSHISGNGPFTKRCCQWMQEHLSLEKVLLTHSCTAALEMAALLLDIQSGDEVILPSFTFVSTANAFALRGAKLKFVDIREDTLNLDERLIERAITDRTRAIVPVHYAGVACDMDPIMAIAEKRGIAVVEDAAQAFQSGYKGQQLGSIGSLGCFSFHETKNLISGEGGALIINKASLIERAEIIWEKGTNRAQFFRGQVDKYTWLDLGSSYLPSDILAAFLYAQLENFDEITRKRLDIFNYYLKGLRPLQEEGKLRLPIIPDYANGNGHLFYILLPKPEIRDELLQKMNAEGINSTFHYIPLHSSPMGQKHGEEGLILPVTERISACLIRLPCFYAMDCVACDHIIEFITHHL